MKKIILGITLITSVWFCFRLFSLSNTLAPEMMNSQLNQVPTGKTETITLGGGCFWCLEAVFQRIEGVYTVESGYMGGQLANPTYEDICTGKTGHAEVTRITFNPQIISLQELLAWFWKAHDPTTFNRQGNDVGTQYRSVIFYDSEDQKNTVIQSKLEAAKDFSDPIVTEISPAVTFYKAEEYHQNYYTQNRTKNPYCRFVIDPKIKKLKLDEAAGK
jgi:peptide-methionine (S)-S-oxide reductase